MVPSKDDFFLVIVLVQVMLQYVVGARYSEVHDEGIKQFKIIIYMDIKLKT